MSKDLLAVISILNNCSIYKLLTLILTYADTHAQGHVISLSLLYTECREGNDLWEPMIRKGKATLLPQAHAPATISTSLLLPLTRNSLPDLHRVNVISVDNLLNLSCFKKAQANTTLPVSVVLISDSSFKYRKFCPKTGTLNPRVIWSSHLLLCGQVCRWHRFILTTCRRTLLLRLVPMNHNERESLYNRCGVTSELWATCMAISLSFLDTSMLSPQSGHQDVQLTGERLPQCRKNSCF